MYNSFQPLLNIVNCYLDWSSRKQNCRVDWNKPVAFNSCRSIIIAITSLNRKLFLQRKIYHNYPYANDHVTNTKPCKRHPIPIHGASLPIQFAVWRHWLARLSFVVQNITKPQKKMSTKTTHHYSLCIYWRIAKWPCS